MREDLKTLNEQIVSGTARVVKKGHSYLLRDIKVEDDWAFDPDILLAYENHLWTDAKAFDENNIPVNYFFGFEGVVYEYKRKNGTNDYSITMSNVTPINPVQYFEGEAQQFYCRNMCLFFEHCYYNCVANEQQVNEVTLDLTAMLLNHYVETLKSENPDFDTDEFLKNIFNELPTQKKANYKQPINDKCNT